MNVYGPTVRLGLWLWLLTGLFALRVVAQPMSLLLEHPLLPRFEAWHSDALPYGLLVASQILILVAMSWTARGIDAGTMALTPPEGPRRTSAAACQ
ncbi:MAG: hypothetical protein FJW27_01160 [Acidimicrobiia bacterium]|nr:hypothetical protein [Acidimicrobiia bacterium]